MYLSICLRCTLKYIGMHNCRRLETFRFFNSFTYKTNFTETLKLSSFEKQLSSQISTFPILLKEFTTKGWKFLARDGEISTTKQFDACEEGNEAIPHPIIVSKLQDCSSVSSQIETFCSSLSITSEDIKRRRAFCQSLEEPFSKYFSHFKIHLFGSSVNGLGFKGCDTDVALQTIFNNEDHLPLIEVPKLSSVIDGTISQETLARMKPRYLLRFVRRILREHCPDVKEPIILIKASCPILRFYNAKYNVFCDFSCESKASLRNTMLLRFLCELDERFKILAKIIRYWGKYGGFVGDIDMFNSYSFSLLVTYFLQTRNPPILPPISEITTKSEYLQNGIVDDNDLLFKDLERFPSSRNSKTVEELLKEFFFYFLTFDLSRVILLDSSSSVPYKSHHVQVKELEENPEEGNRKFKFGYVNLQDPFRASFNVTGTASLKTFRRFRSSLLQVCEAYQNNLLWTPKTENWGLSSLFHRPSSETQMHMKEQSQFYRIEMPSANDAAQKLRKILEHGLLFRCNELCVNHDNDSQQLLKLHCKVYYKTWQGREWVVQEYKQSNNLPLDMEHYISTQLMNKTENKTEVLCEFQCDCSEIRKNSDTRLVCKLNFQKSKFTPILAVFLKDFIPHIFRKL